MAGRVDEIEVVNLTVQRFVFERCGLRLDGYPTLLLDIHRVEDLCTHLAILQTATTLYEPVCERGFAVINVRNDRKVSDVIHQRERLSACKYCEERMRYWRLAIKKGASIATRPEPTIYGNCDSWNFIVGKKPMATSPGMGIFLSLRASNMKVIHNLFTILNCLGRDNMWVICGRPGNNPNEQQMGVFGGVDISEYAEKRLLF